MKNAGWPRTTSSRTRRKVRAGVIVLIAIFGVLFAGGVANASNAGNPHTTGCDQTGATYKTINMYTGSTYMGHADLRYSTGCQTEWTTVYFSGPYTGQPSVWMQNQSGTNLYAAYTDGGESYTYQLGDMKYATGCGGVQMYTSSGGYVGWYYVGCY